MYAKNAPTVLRKQTISNSLPGKVYSVELNEKISDNLRCPFQN